MLPSRFIFFLRRSFKHPKPQQTSPSSTRPYLCLFSTSTSSQSGHNRWSKIRHDKGANDAKRGSAFSKLSQEISTASKTGGTAGNIHLVSVMAAAKKAGMPKERIESAVKRGQGISPAGVALETLIIECMGSGSAALVIECITDNKLRTLQEIKTIIAKSGATNTPTSYLFNKKGLIRISPGTTDFDTILESSLEINGTEDVEEVDDDDGHDVEITTDPSKTSAVTEELKTRLPMVQILSSVIAWVPNEDTMVEIKGGSRAEESLTKLIDQLEALDSVNEVYTNINYKP